MSAPGRPKRESLSAQREGSPMSAPGRPKRESPSAQREGSPVSPRVVQLGDAPPQSWRNGGGVTRELLAWPAPHDWQVRVSVADVDREGPFSAYPGVDRWLGVIDGAGIELVIDGVPSRVERRGAPLRFRGEAAVHCRLIEGATRDLNLMLKGMGGGMLAVIAGAVWRPQASRCGLFAAVDGCCRFDASRIDVAAGSLVWFDPAPSVLVFEAAADDGSGWWLTAMPLEGSA